MQLEDLLALLGSGATVAAPVSDFRWNPGGATLIGFNSLQPFGYGQSTGSFGSATYTSDPFTNGGADSVVMPDARLAVLKNAGFDFCRMAVDVAVLCAAANDTVLDARIAEIIAGVQRRVAAGFKVILDMHVLLSGQHGVPGWSASDLIDGPDGVKFTRLKYVVARLAQTMASGGTSTSTVCIELFNEPPLVSEFSGKTAWETQAQSLWSAVRAVCDYTLVVGGSDLNAVDGLLSGYVGTSGMTALNPANFDDNTGFAFHFYESPVFTHQGVPGGPYQYMSNLTFPASDYPGGLAQAKSDFTAAAGGDANAINSVVTQDSWASSLYTHFNTLGSKANLATRTAVLTSWANTHGIASHRIMNTEFGVAFNGGSDAPEQSAANFVQAVREVSQAAALGSITLHEVQGSAFGFQNSSTPWAINSAIASALFP